MTTTRRAGTDTRRAKRSGPSREIPPWQPLAVFLALAFWTWLWGPMGAFLSSPLLIVALIVKEHLMPVNSPQLPEG